MSIPLRAVLLASSLHRPAESWKEAPVNRMNLIIASALTVWIATAGQAAQTTTSTDQKTAARPANALTLTGCVERADQLAAAATAGTTVDSQQFVLIRAVSATTKAPSPAGTSGAKASPTSLGMMYRLLGDAAKLNPHVGHKVEIVGTLASTASDPVGTTTPSAADAAQLKVQSVKMLAETCGR
jgi:hypothetical protein